MTDTVLGEVRFSNGAEGKYAVVDHEIHMNDVLRILTDDWELEKPALLISVTGGAKNFSLGTRLQEVFRRGLVKVTRSTGAWIISGGNHTGVMKHVGQAVRDSQLTAVSSAPVVAIGIATFGCINQGQKLKYPKFYRKRDTRAVHYNVKKGPETYLDPNHTHFLLVDDHTKDKFGGEITFRACLEKEIGRMRSSRSYTDSLNDSRTVPVVLLVLQGGKNTLRTVKEAVYNSTPVVVISGTGLVADVLAYAYQNIQCEDDKQQGKVYKFDKEVSEEIKRLLREVPNIPDVDIAGKEVEDIMREKTNLITVYHLSTTVSDTQDIDVAILHALLKASEDQTAQLKLALALNRCDIAKTQILTDDRTWNPIQIHAIALTAILENKVEFVQMFFDKVLDVKDFLTKDTLLEMYNNTQQILFKNLLKKLVPSCNMTNITLMDVGRLIQNLIGDFYTPHYLQKSESENDPPESNQGGTDDFKMVSLDRNFLSEEESDPFLRPFADLFIWSVLMNYQEMAKYFWRQDKDKLIRALMANGILHAMAMRAHDRDIETKLQTYAWEFSSLAVEVLNECYDVHAKQAHDLLILNVIECGDVSAIELASGTGNKEFISQMACQSFLTDVWHGKLSLDNSMTKILACVAMPPLIIPILNFLPEELNTGIKVQKKTSSVVKIESPRSSADGNSIEEQLFSVVETGIKPPETRPLTNCEKMHHFYKAPVIVFIHNILSYSVFLVMLSYMLLIDLTNKITTLDCVLIIWVITMFVEEIRQMIVSPWKSAKQKLIGYIFDITWNLLDVVIIVLFIIGMGIRFAPHKWALEVARVILAINLVTFFLRLLHIFSVNKEMGPKLVMIRRMFIDLWYFFIILMVFVVSYGIAAYSILYPNSVMDVDLVFNILKSAYWNLYGELFLEDMEKKEPECTFDPRLYSNHTMSRCPSEVGTYAAPIIMGVYILFSNILLLNLLIAMFSYTFQKVQDNTDLHWSFQRYSLIQEYCNRPPLPPPFIIINHIIRVFSWLIRRCCKSHCCEIQANRLQHGSSIDMQSPYGRQLRKWEKILSDAYLQRKRIKESENLDNKMNILYNRMDEMSKQIETIGTKLTSFIQQQGKPQEEKSSILTNFPSILTPGISFLSRQFGRSTSPVETNKQKTQAITPMGSKTVTEETKSGGKDNIQDGLFYSESRRSPYPGTLLVRESVPEDKVSWKVPYNDYRPVVYEDAKVKKSSNEIDLLALSPTERQKKVKFNTREFINRQSSLGEYQVKDGLPLNPVGRTGVAGRGCLNRWGPNFAATSIITRWRKNTDGSVKELQKTRLLEFICLIKSDKTLSLPRVILKTGQISEECMKENFLNTVLQDPTDVDIRKRVDLVFNNIDVVHVGYVDDIQNTDNAWIETKVYHYHDETGHVLNGMVLKTDDTGDSAMWMTASAALSLHESHSFFLKKVSNKLRAYF